MTHFTNSNGRKQLVQTGFGVDLYVLDPLSDSRWNTLAAEHDRATIFHTTGWLEALRRTYGYTPVAYTTSSPGEPLRNGVVFCDIDSWLTGRRLVSVPFADHCEPLMIGAEDPEFLHTMIERQLRERKCRYVEVRPLHGVESPAPLFHSTYGYCFHQLDLRDDIDTLFRNLHNSVQRKIRRAEREQLAYQVGRSELLLKEFYRLFVMTRRRHCAPPQPLQWFRNLIDCLGEAVSIRVAYKNGQSIAANITLGHNSTLMYKYGASDAAFNSLGGVHLLLWESIQEAKRNGLRTFDLGRSDRENAGLITFKGRWGATQSELTYCRYASSAHSHSHYRETGSDWKLQVAKHVFVHTPTSFLSAIGKIFYKHIG